MPPPTESDLVALSEGNVQHVVSHAYVGCGSGRRLLPPPPPRHHHHLQRPVKRIQQ